MSEPSGGYLVVTGSGPTHWTALPASIVFKAQPVCDVCIDLPPILSWSDPAPGNIGRRIRRLSALSPGRLRVDLASFLIPSLPEALDAFPELRVLHIQGGDPGTVEREYCRYLDRVCPLPTSYWGNDPTGRWHVDPIWDRAYPKYPGLDRGEAIRRYAEEVEERIASLVRTFPDRVLAVPREELFTPCGVQRILDYSGISKHDRKTVGPTPGATATVSVHPRLGVRSVSPLDPQRCCVLVPCNTHIHHETEDVLRQLEDVGYPVRRQYGVSAIDQARSRMATEAILDGFEETLWVDSDMVFAPESVDHLRSLREPFVSGLYSKRGGGCLASALIDEAAIPSLGNQGGLTEIRYAATGFLLVHREAYLRIQRENQLPVCNELFQGTPVIPFFQPMVVEHEESYWYLGEDYSFSERARRAGLRILADTRIRLWHVGDYRYGWEDAVATVERQDGRSTSGTSRRELHVSSGELIDMTPSGD